MRKKWTPIFYFACLLTFLASGHDFSLARLMWPLPVDPSSHLHLDDETTDFVESTSFKILQCQEANGAPSGLWSAAVSCWRPRYFLVPFDSVSPTPTDFYATPFLLRCSVNQAIFVSLFVASGLPSSDVKFLPKMDDFITRRNACRRHQVEAACECGRPFCQENARFGMNVEQPLTGHSSHDFKEESCQRFVSVFAPSELVELTSFAS
jgi:hypothetical protein